MKYSHLLPATMFVVAAASFSFNAISADTSVTESSSIQVQEQHDQVASLNSILDFEEAAKNEQTTSEYERCSPTIYTRSVSYTHLRAHET